MNAPLREIYVRARDGDGTLLRGALFSWTEDGQDRGRIDPSDGHTVLRPVSATSIVEVVVSYEGQEQRRKLAVDQTLCEFDYPHVRLPAPAMAMPAAPTAPAAQPAAAAPSTPTPATRSRWRVHHTVLVALITTLGAVAVGYWQYGPPSRAEAAGPKQTTLAVYVTDATSAAPVPRAQVSLQSPGMVPPRQTDDRGGVAFELPAGQSGTVTLSVQAPQYESRTLQVQLPVSQPVTVSLKALRARPGAGASRPPAAVALAGSWEVRVDGHLALKRLSRGVFDFAALPDGRSTVRASLQLDGLPVELDGHASRQNERVFLQYRARAGAEDWSGQGELAQAGSTLSGYLTDRNGQQVPVTLRKP